MTPKKIWVKVQLPEDVHTRAKAKAVNRRQRLQDWVIAVLTKATNHK